MLLWNAIKVVLFVIGRLKYCRVGPKELPCSGRGSTICWSLPLAKSMGVDKLIVESDSKVCVEALSSEHYNPHWELKTLVDDINFFSRSFPIYIDLHLLMLINISYFFLAKN